MPRRPTSRTRRTRPVVEGLEGRQLLAASITELPISSVASEVARGPDGNLWYLGKDRIGRVSPGGQVAEFALPIDSEAFPPKGLTAGPDGNLWFAQSFTLFRVSTAGEVTLTVSITPIQSGDYFGAPAPTDLAAGPDGNVWFTSQATNTIGRVTPDGVVTQFALPTAGRRFITPVGITAGPDGNVWFTERDANKVGRITPDGTITEFDAGPDPLGIAAGPDGNLWVTTSRAIVRMTTEGVATPFSMRPTVILVNAPDPQQNWPGSIVAGPDGNLWFSNERAYGEDRSLVGRITPEGVITTMRVGVADALTDIAPGPDGSLWLSQAGSAELVRFQPSYGDLSVSMAAQAPYVAEGSSKYPVTITVTNVGPTPITGGRVELFTPEAVYVESSSVGFLDQMFSSGSENRVRITGIGALAPGQSIAITVRARSGAGPQAIRAVVQGDESDTNTANNRATLTIDGQPSGTPGDPGKPVPPVATPPVVSGVSKVRSKKKGLTSIVVRFDQAMDPTAMTSLATYRLTTAPAGKKAKPKKVPLRSATFDVVGNAATLTLSKPQKAGKFRLTVLAAGARSLAGLAPSGDFAATL